MIDDYLTKDEKRLVTIMLVGGLFITALSIIPTGESDHEVDMIMIIVNVFYWAMTIILLNLTFSSVLLRKIQESHNSRVSRENNE